VNKKTYAKYMMLTSVITMFVIVFVSGPINSLFSKYRDLKMDLPIFGTIIFLILGSVIEWLSF
jgi:surface polysaccharide O-acyltransferase-like enzyme